MTDVKKIIKFIVVVVATIICCNIYESIPVRYSDSDYIEFSKAITLNNITEIRTSHNNIITSPEDISAIIQFLSSNSVAELKKRDHLPNESPDFSLRLKSEDFEREIMLYGNCYVLIQQGDDTVARYKVKNKNFFHDLQGNLN